jgi:hypothetical protein
MHRAAGIAAERRGGGLHERGRPRDGAPGLPATASIDDVQAARDEIQAAWDKVTAEAVDLDEADEAAVQDALDGVFQSIDEFPTDEPIEDGLASVQDATGDVQTANQEMADGLGCNVEQ